MRFADKFSIIFGPRHDNCCLWQQIQKLFVYGMTPNNEMMSPHSLYGTNKKS